LASGALYHRMDTEAVRVMFLEAEGIRSLRARGQLTTGRLRDLFHRFDTDNSGTLTPDELAGILTRPGGGEPMTLAEARDFIDQFDRDSDGALSYSELAAAMALSSPVGPPPGAPPPGRPPPGAPPPGPPSSVPPPPPGAPPLGGGDDREQMSLGEMYNQARGHGTSVGAPALGDDITESHHLSEQHLDFLKLIMKVSSDGSGKITTPEKLTTALFTVAMVTRNDLRISMLEDDDLGAQRFHDADADADAP